MAHFGQNRRADPLPECLLCTSKNTKYPLAKQTRNRSGTFGQRHVQITVNDIPSEDYSASYLWSDGDDALPGSCLMMQEITS